jgi:hypothetical protein
LYSLDYARLLPRAFQANGFAVVRFGILPPRSGHAGMTKVSKTHRS